MELFDNSWVEEYERLEKNYEMFYKETVENVKLFYVYVSKNNQIENVHQDDAILNNGTLIKDKMLDLIKTNKNKNGISYRLKHLLKYNISLASGDVQDFLHNKINETYLSPITFLEDIYFEKTINILQDLNSIYFIFREKETQDTSHSQTKKITLINRHRKTRRKTT